MVSNSFKNKIYSTFALPTVNWRSAILVKLDNTVIQYFIQEIKQQIQNTIPLEREYLQVVGRVRLHVG